MKQTHRVKTLEGNQQVNAWGKPHRIICRNGQSIDEAKAEYRLDKIAAGDVVIVRTFVSRPGDGPEVPNRDPPSVLKISW
ncbi:MAG: hypothetical protein ABIO35_09025 [Nitrobacter sp.]